MKKNTSGEYINGEEEKENRELEEEIVMEYERVGGREREGKKMDEEDE